MNTQDTTLPPLPEQERAEFEAWAKRRCFDLTILEDDESDEYKELETESAWEAWQARAAIAAQAQPQEAPADWLHLKHYGYAPGNYMSRCSDCGQTPAMDKRATRCRPCAEAAFGKAQQAQGVPAALTDRESAIIKFCMAQMQDLEDEEWRDHGFRAIEFRSADQKLRAMLAAAPQAEHQPEREPLTRSIVSDEEIRAWVKRHDLSSSLSIGHYRAMVEDARTIKLAGIDTKGGDK